MEGLPSHSVHRPRRRAGDRTEDLLTPRRIVLLRHGRTADNASGRIQGQLDTPLDDVGRAQATVAAQVLAELAPDVVVTSDLVRAADTAAVVAAPLGLVPVPDPRLRELDLGAWQGLTSEEAHARFPDEHEAWRRGRDVARGGGETYREAGERAAAAVRAHLPAAGTLLAVTHGGTARGALGVLLELPSASWPRLVALGNACWSVLVEGDLGWRLERHNAGVGPLVGAHDVGGRPAVAAPRSRDVEPVR